MVMAFSGVCKFDFSTGSSSNVGACTLKKKFLQALCVDCLCQIHPTPAGLWHFKMLRVIHETSHCELLQS
jgi:hypothetical protein